MTEVVIGIDIGGTNTEIGIVTGSGECLVKSSMRTDAYFDAKLFVEEIARNINEMLSNYPGSNFSGIGIGAPNGNFFKGTIEYAPNLKWRGVVHLVEMMKNHFKVPILLTNDANAAAMGDMIYGGAKNMKNFVLITLGTGLGSGFVVNGELLYGHDGFAGEFGHINAFPNGRLCGCGRLGCLETYCSASGITKTVIELLGNTEESSVLRNLRADEISSKLIYEAALKGDTIALKAFDFTCRVLGTKLADIVAITSPEAIFLFGGLAGAKEFIFSLTKKYMEESLLSIFKNKVKILPSVLPQNNAAILGAAALIKNM